MSGERPEEERVKSIRALLNDPIEQTAPNNHAQGWRRDCDYLLTEFDEKSARLVECSPYLRSLASQCEFCQGSGEVITGEVVIGPRDEEAASEPCVHCKPIWDLIERIEPKPQSVPVVAVEKEEDDIAF
jgi:hypothetical protein